MDNDLVVRMVGREVSNEDDDEVHQLGLVVMLAIVEEIGGNVTELEADSFTSEDVLDVVVPDQPLEQGAGLHGHVQRVLGQGGWHGVPLASVTTLVEQHPVQHRHGPTKLGTLENYTFISC